MAHFCELDKKNIIKRVIVVHNNELLVDGKEVEAKGIEFLQGIFGQDTKWVQCSYNSNFRGFFPSCNDRYDEENDVFIDTKNTIPKEEWTNY